jgi:hypothetical protein
MNLRVLNELDKRLISWAIISFSIRIQPHDISYLMFQ